MTAIEISLLWSKVTVLVSGEGEGVGATTTSSESPQNLHNTD